MNELLLKKLSPFSLLLILYRELMFFKEDPLEKYIFLLEEQELLSTGFIFSDSFAISI